MNDERLENVEGFRIKEYINRVRACLNASIGNAVTNAEKCHVFYLLLPFYNLLFHLIEGERELVPYRSCCHFLYKECISGIKLI